MSELPLKYIMDGDSQKQLVQGIDATTERTLQTQQVHVTHEKTETTTTTTTTTTSTTKTCVQVLDDSNTTILFTEDPSELPARDYMEAKPLKTQMCMQMISTWNQQRKKGKGTSWSEYEHRLFLDGLRIYGKGNWKSISKYVKSRSPTQVASHAQKYFIRQNASTEQKRRKSILDITLDTLDKRRDCR